MCCSHRKHCYNNLIRIISTNLQHNLFGIQYIYRSYKFLFHSGGFLSAFSRMSPNIRCENSRIEFARNRGGVVYGGCGGFKEPQFCKWRYVHRFLALKLNDTCLDIHTFSEFWRLKLSTRTYVAEANKGIVTGI